MIANVNTNDGRPLDSYCETMRATIEDLLDPIRELAGASESGAFDPNTIPSRDQREGMLLVRELLEWSESLLALLRYDVCVPHDECPEHDEYMRKAITKARERLSRRLAVAP